MVRMSVQCAVGLVVLMTVGLSSAVVVVTGVCKSDSECMAAKGDGACCAAMSPDPLFRGVPVCKMTGQEKEPCHVASNVLPYPLPSPRIFWRCPCGPGLRCVAPRGGKVGRCKRDSQAFSAGLDGEDLVV
ncbi:PROK1 [Branchiostoma lanceolatum]|uniref:PROK1 protein n=1 Tax=Branchiostoma lanceolatum TaxID=7740 RepID=A0A8K0AF93_BRALA|nr:PROK1 [Branchiostoma lanceolatum]